MVIPSEARPAHRTLRHWAYDTLKELIVSGQLEPGQALVEAKLSTDLGISRSPIREALRQLGHDGLVVSTPNSGTIVSPIDTSEIDQVFEVRDLLESCLIAHATLVRTRQEIESAERLVSDMPAAVDAVDIHAYARLDVAFHHHLWSMAHRPRVMEVLIPVADQSRRFLSLSSRRLQTESSETLGASYREHLEMLAAITAGDVDRAVTATRRHMESSRRRILNDLNQEGMPETLVGASQRRLAYTVTWTEKED